MIILCLITLFNSWILAFNPLPPKIEINESKWQLSLMGDLEGTSIIIKIKDATNKNIGVFKPTSGSTNHRGEYAFAKLGTKIGLDIFPDVLITSMSTDTLKKIKTTLLEIEFNKFYGDKHVPHMKAKERNRKQMLDNLDNLIQKNKNMEGVLKSWVNNIQFYVPLGSMQGFKNNIIKKFLTATYNQPENKNFVMKQCTQLFEPYGCYLGYAYHDEVSRDFSTLLVLDAIFANRDRFAGGNVHFRSVDNKVSNKNKNEFIFKNARLLSLDNGAVLHKNDKSAYKLLKKLNISRFVKKHIESLKTFFNKTDNEIKKELYINDEEIVTIKNNYLSIMDYINSLEKKHSKQVWFIDQKQRRPVR